MTEFDSHERDVLAQMLMRSLRGSFFPVNPRCRLLKEIAGEGLSVYDADRIIEKVDWHVQRDYPDGRTFRNIYQEGPDLAEYTDEAIVRELSNHVPDDLTWTDWRIKREFEGNPGEAP